MSFSVADRLQILRLKYENCVLQLAVLFLRIDLFRKGGFNPNQPRVPRGNPTGGQWTDGGGGGGGGR